jgi:GNAT superfamily N-acetyltransferase
MNECKVIFGYDKMDFVKVTEMLSKVYWCIGINETEVRKGAKNSALVAGAFIDSCQVGFARVISDKTRFAYLTDVVIDDSFRKTGIASLIVDNIIKHNDLKDIYQWLLVTKDAHGVYEKFGFEVLKNPEMWMGIINKRPER